jgi:hypothetical protein
MSTKKSSKKNKDKSSSTAASTASTPRPLSLQAYMQVAEKAVAAFHYRNFRESADFYLQAVTRAPTKWALNRYHLFAGYTSILREKYFKPSPRDMTALQHDFVDNIKEPMLFRSKAAFTIGLLHWDAGERELAADYYRQGIACCQGADAMERERETMATNANGTGMGQIKVGDLLGEIYQDIQRNLHILENPLGGRPPPGQETYMRSDGTRMPKDVRSTNIPILTGPAPFDLMKRSAVGGKVCDCCAKPREDTGLTSLLVCARCKMAFYCSADCQKKQWKAGHKQACRKQGQIEVGDYMKLQGLTSKPELNGQFVQVTAPMVASSGRWPVQVQVNRETTGAQAISVKPENLERIRPAM